MVHQIGRVTLKLVIYRKQRLWEVYVDGKIEATERDSWQHALYRVRQKYPKPYKPEEHRPPSHMMVNGELYAYRAWQLCGDILMPLAYAPDWNVWSGPVARLANVSEDGSDGFWAVKFDEIKNLFSQYRGTIHVHGIVALSGKVIEYERGYRAQRCTIRVLRVRVPVSEEFLQILSDRYQCQVFREKKPGNSINEGR